MPAQLLHRTHPYLMNTSAGDSSTMLTNRQKVGVLELDFTSEVFLNVPLAVDDSPSRFERTGHSSSALSQKS
jgi:hypothetical protein